MTPLISLQTLTKTYISGDAEVQAVKSVTLDIQPGEFIAIMGSSGSGKSTLMNILGCLDRPTAGKYLLDNIDVATLKRDQLADVRNSKIGFVFQGFNLLSRTSALENVELPMMYHRSGLSRRKQHEKAKEMLHLVGLGNRLDHMPNQLSGGQQQRVAIARSLVNDPVLLLADEPTGNLDSRTSIEIMEMFQRLNDTGITIVMVTHEPDIASYTKRNIEMRDGLVRSDQPVQHRLIASQELEAHRGLSTPDASP
jgi:putative ABC transport system ATP-binding protein